MVELILTREFPPQDGGISAVAYEMAKHWGKQGKSIQVLCWDYKKGKWPSTFQDQNHEFTIKRIPQPTFRFLQIYQLVSELFRIHKINKIKRIWATSWNFSGVACCVFSFFTAVPYAVLTHGYEVSKKALSRSDRFLLRWSLKWAAKVFAVSRYTRDHVRGVAPHVHDVKFVPNGIDAQKFIPQASGIDEFRQRFHLKEKKVLLTVARLFPRKGHDQVLKALPHVIKKIPNVHYLIVGEGPSKEALKKMANDLGLNSYVTFAGFIQDQDLPACYAACDIFVLPNRVIDDPQDPWVGDFEGFGISFIEASAAGKPVIAGNTGGAPDAVIDGVTGFLVSPTDSDQIAAKIILLLNDTNLADRMGRQGRERVEQELHWPRVLQQYEAAFAHL